jgi:hypothetical protein
MRIKYSEAFEIWWNENKNSESLQDNYQNYLLDVKYVGGKSMSFKKWASDEYIED